MQRHERQICIFDVKALQHVDQRGAEVGGCRVSSRAEWRAEQDDAEIGIGADGGESRSGLGAKANPVGPHEL